MTGFSLATRRTRRTSMSAPTTKNSGATITTANNGSRPKVCQRKSVVNEASIIDPALARLMIFITP